MCCVKGSKIFVEVQPLMEEWNRAGIIIARLRCQSAALIWYAAPCRQASMKPIAVSLRPKDLDRR